LALNCENAIAELKLSCVPEFNEAWSFITFCWLLREVINKAVSRLSSSLTLPNAATERLIGH
jgi:hypothetical protein